MKDKVKVVVFLRSNPIKPDPRVEKEARALSQAGFKVIVVGWDRSGLLPTVEEREFGVLHRIRLPSGYTIGIRNLPCLIRWQLHLLRWLFRNRQVYDIIHACDFDTVLPALLAKCFLRKKVVYDVFDFYAEMLRRTPKFVCSIIRNIDLIVMSKVDAVIIADEMRIAQIRRARPKRLAIVRNSPPLLPLPEIRKDEKYVLRVAYVGLLQVERGILEVLELMRQHPDWHLDLAGFGGDELLIIDKAKCLANVDFHGRVNYDVALQLMANADLLFATYDPRIPNHRYSSPNKVFEAMMLGKPIIVARGMGIDSLVEQEKVGFVVDYGDVEQLEKAMSEVARWNCAEKQAFAQHVRGIFEKRFSWERSQESLVKLYKELDDD